MESQPDFLRAFSGLTVREATVLGNKMGYRVIISHALPEMGHADFPAKGEIGLWMGKKGERVDRATLGRGDPPEHAPRTSMYPYQFPTLLEYQGLTVDEAIALGRKAHTRVIVAKTSPDARQVTLPKHAEIGLWLDRKGRVEHAEHSAADLPSPIELAMSRPVPPVLPYGHPYFTTAPSQPLFLPSAPTRSSLPVDWHGESLKALPPNPYRSWSTQPPLDRKPVYGSTRCSACKTQVNESPLAGFTYDICSNCHGQFCEQCAARHLNTICKGKIVTHLSPMGG